VLAEGELTVSLVGVRLDDTEDCELPEVDMDKSLEVVREDEQEIEDRGKIG